MTGAIQHILHGGIADTEPLETVFGVQIECNGRPLRRETAFALRYHADGITTFESPHHQNASGGSGEINGTEVTVARLLVLRLVHMTNQNDGALHTIRNGRDAFHDGPYLVGTIHVHLAAQIRL